MRSTDIVAYTYQAELLCPDCINERFQATSQEDTEAVLDGVASNWGVNRQDESSFDSGEFPKVVFADQAYHCEDCKDYEYEVCGGCGEPIIND